MDEEVEDCIGDVKYTDSQNTISTSLIYQVSVNGSNSDEHNTSSKGTYVIECDSDDSINTCEVNFSKTVLYANFNCSNSLKHGIDNAKETMKAALTNNQDCTVVAQETYTQTSKTIIQLAKAEQGMMDTCALQTQTSRLLITEKQSKEVKIEVHCPSAIVASDFLGNFKFHRKETIMPCSKINEYYPNAHKHEIEDILNIVDDFNDGSRDNSFTNSHSGCELSDREMDNDSLSDEHKEYPVSESSETPKSVRKDAEELYKKISEMDIFGVKRTDTNNIKPIAALTPLTEESVRKDSDYHLIGNNQNIIQNKLILKDKSISDSLLYNESMCCPNLISNYEKHNENKIAENKSLCNNAQSCLFDSQMRVKTADSSNGQIHKTVKIENDDNVKITPNTASAMTMSPDSDQNFAITSRSCFTCFSSSDKLSDIYEEKCFDRHEKVLCQISSLFTKKHGKQQVPNNENTPHPKKSVTISVGENQDSMKLKHNDNENNASQTTPKKSLDQDTQYDNKIIPAYVNYAPSESSNGNESNAHTIDAEGIDINIKLLPDPRTRQNKLPQIEGKTNDKPVSCPNSSRVNVLLTVNASAKRPASKPEVLPHIRKGKSNSIDFSTASSKILAKDGNNNEETIRLPPIKDRKTTKSAITKHRLVKKLHNPSHSEVYQDMISVDGMIRELRTSPRPKSSARSHRNSRSLSRGQSPASVTASEIGPSLERACDNMLTDIMRRLRSLNWLEVIDTLNDIPRQMAKFWSSSPETRVADLIRQEFFEATSSLLAKSGSYNRCVRRAANLALDDVISSVELTKAVSALTVHGADHKGPLVRSATARLLVVCCALGGGGGDLLKSKPPSIATARRLTLTALSVLLEDKNIETRKFAERLYIMLRQQSNFEAFYLTDVDVDLASRQLKKYDRLLFETPEETPRKIR